MKVYVLHHEREMEGDEEVKLVGVYASEGDAREAKDRALRRPGFADAPDGFSIDGYELGRDHRIESFVTARWGEDETPSEGQDRAA